MADENQSPEKPVQSKKGPSYRGPPPRKDLVQSPMKSKDWKGNDIFKERSAEPIEGMDRTSLQTPDVGIFPGLLNGAEVYDDRPVSRGREYDSEYVKLSMKGGHSNLIQSGGDEASESTERRQKTSDNLSEFNKISIQGGHKDLLRPDVESTDEPDSGRRQKSCDTENLSHYNKLAKTGGHKDLLRMDVKPEPVDKKKGCTEASEYSKMALQGGHKDLLKLEGIQTNGVHDEKPKKKVNSDEMSEFTKMSIDGGHKDILRTDRPTEPETVRKLKACDAENLSKYNKLAKTGGHKNLLKMDAKHDIDTRRTKGCHNPSDYSKMALQGGHRDLLVIEENKPASRRMDYQRQGGDWFEHNNNNDIKNNNKNETTRPASASGRRPAPTNGHQNQSNGILPAGIEQASKGGKKRFEPSQRSQAPFATYF
eukprot:TCONS_00020770-protein